MNILQNYLTLIQPKAKDAAEDAHIFVESSNYLELEIGDSKIKFGKTSDDVNFIYESASKRPAPPNNLRIRK